MRFGNLIDFIAGAIIMRNLQARVSRLETKKPLRTRVMKIYWDDGTFIGEIRY
jgi:hypothetical protein